MILDILLEFFSNMLELCFVNTLKSAIPEMILDILLEFFSNILELCFVNTLKSAIPPLA